MKKFTMTFLVALLVVSLSAQGIGLSINIDPIGYMNHTIVTTYDKGKLVDNLSDKFEDALGGGNLQVGDQKRRDIYNAYALGLDISYSFFYGSISIGLPAKIITNGFDVIERNWPGAYKDSNKIGGTVILDGQLGGGITLLKEKPINIFVGGGIAINYIHVKRPIASDSALLDKLTDVKSMTEYRNIVQAGLGLRAGVTYNFMPNVGVNLSLSDSLHFLKFYNQTKFGGELKDGTQYTYMLSKDGKDNEMIKRQFANNFVLRLGVGLKF